MMAKILSFYLFIGILLLMYLFVHSFSRGKSNHTRALGALSLSIQIYLLGYLMEINMTQLDQLMFWNQVQYFGIPFFPALWLLVSIIYTGRVKHLKGIHWVLIFGVPVVTFIARLTNHLHHLYYTEMYVKVTRGVTLMFLSKGPAYVFQMSYVLVTLLLCTWFYYQRYKKSKGTERMPFRLLLIASVLPYVALVLVALNMGGTGIDFTAIILPPCVYLINLALTRYNFLEVKALARERVFLDSELGLVILNNDYHVVDYNERSAVFFSWLGEHMSYDHLDQLLEHHQSIWEDIQAAQTNVVCIEHLDEAKYLDISVKPIHNHQEISGFLLTMEDVTERELLKESLMNMANTDGLSGLNNRRHFSETAQEIFQRAIRYRETFCVLMMDIDYFKKINDSYGHAVGDDVIRTFAKLMKSVFRSTDVIGRMGGEEFAVIMINTDLETAHKKSEEFRLLVANHLMEFEDYTFNITVSIGISTLTPDTPNFDSMINHADKLLYLAKDAGRNQTMI